MRKKMGVMKENVVERRKLKELRAQHLKKNHVFRMDKLIPILYGLCRKLCGTEKQTNFWHTFLDVEVHFSPAHRTNAVRNWSSSLGGTISWYSTIGHTSILSTHPVRQQPGPEGSGSARPALGTAGRARSLCRVGVETLHSGQTLHCLVAKGWMNRLAAELPISTSGFPECALPSMCQDCSAFKTRPAVPSGSDLQAQLSVQSGSAIRAQRSLHTQESSLQTQETARGFIVLSETVCKAAGSGITATLFSSNSQGCTVTGN